MDYLIFFSALILIPLFTWLGLKISIIKKYGRIKSISPASGIAWRNSPIDRKHQVLYELRKMIEDLVEREIIVSQDILLDVMKNTEIRTKEKLRDSSPGVNKIGAAHLSHPLYAEMHLCRKYIIVLDASDLRSWKMSFSMDKYNKAIAYVLIHELMHHYLNAAEHYSDHNHVHDLWKEVDKYSCFKRKL